MPSRAALPRVGVSGKKAALLCPRLGGPGLAGALSAGLRTCHVACEHTLTRGEELGAGGPRKAARPLQRCARGSRGRGAGGCSIWGQSAQPALGSFSRRGLSRDATCWTEPGATLELGAVPFSLLSPSEDAVAEG